MAKIGSEDQNWVNLAKGLRFYEAEDYFYGQLMSEESVPVPECYYTFAAPDKCLIILEDLNLKDLRCGNQVEGASAEEAQVILETLAKFHAFWWGHKKMTDKNLPLPPAGDDPQTFAVLDAVMGQCLPPFLKKAESTLTREQLNLASNFVSNMKMMFQEMSHFPTLAHGDARLDNVFFGKKGKNQEVILIDWQLMVRAPVALDVSYLISQSMTVENRRKHEQTLVKHYHKKLLEHGVKGYSFDQFWKDYCLSMLYHLRTGITGWGMSYNEQTEKLGRLFAERGFTAASDLNSVGLIGSGKTKKVA
jgi:aminoglycoside/choline kinase family phosphotransferase